MLSRLLKRLPLGRFPARLRWVLLSLAGFPPVIGADDPPAPPAPAPPAPDPPAPPDPPRTYTQDDVNRIVQDRLARDRRDRPSDDEIAELRQAKTRLDEIERDGQSDLERAQQTAQERERERDEARENEQKALELVNRTQIRAAVVAAAAREGAVDPDDVFVLLDGNGAFKGDDAKVTVGDDGQVTGHEEAVKELLEAKPQLVGTTPPGHLGGGGGGPRPAPRPEGDMTAEQARELAQNNPQEFTKKLRAGEIPADALKPAS